LGGSWLETSPDKKFARPPSQPIKSKKLVVVVHTCHLSCGESINRRITVQAGPSKNARPCLKNKTKKHGGVAQMIEHLSKHKALSSNFSTAKKEKKIIT
jgi:hypothetical protein